MIAALLALKWWGWPTEPVRAAAPVLSAEPTPDRLAALRKLAEKAT